MLQGGSEAGFAKIEQENPWLSTTPLVVKPDQLIKRRGKAGLLAVNKTWPEVQAWVAERMGKSQQVCDACAAHQMYYTYTLFTQQVVRARSSRTSSCHTRRCLGSVLLLESGTGRHGIIRYGIPQLLARHESVTNSVCIVCDTGVLQQ